VTTPLASVLADSRAELTAALASVATVTVLGAGPWSAPAVLLSGGAPWVEPLPGPTHARAMGPGSYRVRWGVLLVAGRLDSQASQGQLETLAAAALDALAGLADWERPYVSAPRQQDLFGGQYLTAALLASRVYQTWTPQPAYSQAADSPDPAVGTLEGN
jgi:hypothetical protein